MGIGGELSITAVVKRRPHQLNPFLYYLQSAQWELAPYVFLLPGLDMGPLRRCQLQFASPELDINKHFLLLRKCSRVPCAGSWLDWERKQTVGYLGQTSRRCGKARVAAPEQGHYKQNAHFGKQRQSHRVWERQPPRLDPGSQGGENRAPFRFLGTANPCDFQLQVPSGCHLRHQTCPLDAKITACLFPDKTVYQKAFLNFPWKCKGGSGRIIFPKFG